MRVTSTAKNGQILMAYKSYGELTDEEKAALTFAWAESKEDYTTYQVRYNKSGNLLGVKGHAFSKAKEAELAKPAIDMVDSMQLLFGKKHSHNYEAAKKRAGASSKEINAARRIVKGLS